VKPTPGAALVFTDAEVAMMGPVDLRCTNGVIHVIDRVLLTSAQEASLLGTSEESEEDERLQQTSGKQGSQADPEESGGIFLVIVLALVGLVLLLSAAVGCLICRLRRKGGPLRQFGDVPNTGNVVVGQPVREDSGIAGSGTAAAAGTPQVADGGVYTAKDNLDVSDV